MLLTFNATTRITHINVDLKNDNVFETDEDFSGILTLVYNSPRVTISPDNTLVTIEDDEGKQNSPHRT